MACLPLDEVTPLMPGPGPDCSRNTPVPAALHETDGLLDHIRICLCLIVM